jgi:hypothetical protein
MSEALRFNEGKPSLAYILQFANPIKAIARIMEFGATKYADGNWRKGGKPDREYLDSMMRHLTDWVHGEKYDKDSGCSHLGHAIWNLMALHELNHPDEIIDDEVFKRQCAHWKAKKEKRPEEGLQEDDTETSFTFPDETWDYWEGNDCGWWAYHADSVLTKKTSEKQKEEEEPQDNNSVDPARIFDDQTCEAFKASLRDIVFEGLTGQPVDGKPSTKTDDGEEQKEEEDLEEVKPAPPKCPECGYNTSSFRATWECDCGWWGFKAESGLTKKTDGGEKQKEGPQEDKISFVIRDDAKCKSFEDLVQRLMAEELEVKLRDAFFNYLGDANVAPLKGNK